MEIDLTSNVFKVIGIKRKSRAEMLEDLKIGDEIVFELQLKHLGSSRGRTYAPYVMIRNYKTQEYTFKSFNQLDSVLDAFELE